MRIVVVGDLHLDAVTMGVARFDEIVRALDETVDCAIQTGADLWVQLGDVFDPDAGPVAYRALRELVRVVGRLRNADVPVAFVAGNHDVVEDGTGTTTLSPLAYLEGNDTPGLPHVDVFDRPGVFRVDAKGGGRRTIVSLPYTATSHAYDPEEFVDRKLEGTRDAIVLGHLVVPGVSPGEEAVEFARGRDVFFPTEACLRNRVALMLQGHHHLRQTTGDGVMIPGALSRLTFGEESYKPGFLICEV